ncbi:Cell division trigger factor [hydrothermal vent metagenome]|uniref:peptidylprolyl isomerase n=1 Tax=hydrothermal vent metagenome TaxID=652676 RepID=A0A1W1CGC4_9ZZZZ
MEVTAKKIDDANVLVSAKILKSDLEEKINRLAKEAGKQIKVDGFRKGKVPVHVVKSMYGEKLEQDAEGEAVREIIDQGSSELGLKPESILGQPIFKKYDKTDDGIDIEIELSLRPDFDPEGYSELMPEFDMPVVDDTERDERLASLLEAQAPLEKIEDERPVAHDDTVVMDFEGSIDGELFDGGAAQDFTLKVGSNQFIPGFEDQMIGMNTNEEKVITVTFPEDYHSKDLAGKEANFKVTVKEIQEKKIPELDDELAAKLLQGEENPSVDLVKEKISEQIKHEKISKMYNDELKPKLVEALVRHYEFALPNNIVEQEIDAKINEKAQTMSEDELNEYKENPEKIETLRDEVRSDAQDSVRATFIVDAIARKEEVSVSDEEVTQTIYYEAMMSGQNPQDVVKHYQDNNLLPAIKMGMIEDKLFAKLLGFDK